MLAELNGVLEHSESEIRWKRRLELIQPFERGWSIGANEHQYSYVSNANVLMIATIIEQAILSEEETERTQRCTDEMYGQGSG